MKIEQLDISQIKPNPKNPRTITSEKLKSLVRSIKDFPQMLELRPLVVDKKGVVIGGNMRLAAAKEAGLKKIPVMRAESLTPAQVKEFIIKDNVGFGEWDWDALANEWDVQKLEEWGLDISFEEKQQPYTRKIESPHYEPTGRKPRLSEIIDQSKFTELVSEIDKSSLPEDEKAFLRTAATRHIVVNFELAAEYYAHANKELQTLMEQQALVIIDFHSAIDHGFVKLTKTLAEIRKSDEKKPREK